MNKMFLAAAALFALNGRFGIGEGAIDYIAATLAALCLVGTIVSTSWVKQSGVAPIPWKPLPTGRLLLVLAVTVALAHLVDYWSYPELTLSGRFAIDLFTFGAALLAFLIVLHVRKRIDNTRV